MPKDISELLRKFDQLEDIILQRAPDIADEIAQNAAAVVIHRIQTEGLEGQQYSTNFMLATESQFNRKSAFKATEVATTLGRDENGKLVKGGVRNSKGEINKRKTGKRLLFIKFPGASKAVPVMLLPGGYKQLRELNGLPSNNVDLTFSGRMFQNIKVLNKEKSGLKFTSLIGATNQENRDKIRGHRQHYGNFLAPNRKEAITLVEIPKNRINEIFKQVLG